MLYRAEQGQYPWWKAILIAVAVLGLAIAAGLWHSHAWGTSAHAEFIWGRCYFTALLLAGLTFGIGLALRHVAWPRFLTWLGVISCSVLLLHPALIQIYRHLAWTAHHSFWFQVAIDALFLAILLAVCSVTYLLVERPMQDLGRRLAHRLDARFGPDRSPVPMRAPEPALAHNSAPPNNPRYGILVFMAPPTPALGPPAPLAAPLPSPRDPSAPYRVCLVCLGNICRSPMAETVLRAALDEAGLAKAVTLDSSGTADWHVGEPMYPQARRALARRGYDGSAHRARQFRASWLADRDLVLAMDAGNLATLRRMAGPADRDRIRLFGEVGGLGERSEIPDPYGGNEADFGHVLDLLGAAGPVIAARLAQLLGRPGVSA